MNKRAAINDLARTLRDPVATVRLASLVSLVAAGVKDFNGEDGKYFADAKALYERRAALTSDDAAQLYSAGRIFLLTGDVGKASRALEDSMKIDPEMQAD